MGRGPEAGCESENLPGIRIAYHVSRDWNAAHRTRIFCRWGGPNRPYPDAGVRKGKAVASNAGAAVFFIAPSAALAERAEETHETEV